MKDIVTYITEEKSTFERLKDKFGRYLGKVFINTTIKYKSDEVCIFQSKVNEGLIKTYPTKTIIQSIINELNKNNLLIPDNLSVQISKEDSTFDIFGVVSFILKRDEFNERTINIIQKQMEVGGYERTFKHFSREYRDEIVEVIQFNPKYQHNHTTKIGRYIWHVTEEKYVDKIKQKGICPSNRCKKVFNYSPRNYFFITDNLLNIKNYIFSSGKNKSSAFYLLKVDTKGLNVDFFKDNTYDPSIAIYCYDNIPPSNIIKYIQIK